MFFCRNTALSLCFGLATSFTALAQATNNDGFQRRNGQMQILRNGHARPMTRDIHLPTGTTVTKDGFVVGPDGKRTELREGQGCDLRGRPVALLTAPNGTVALAPLAQPRAVSVEREAPVGLLEELFGRRDDDKRYKYKKPKKGKGRGKGHWKDDD